MKPNTLKLLQAQTPEMAEFRDFLRQEIDKLDRVSDVTGEPNHYALEVRARQEAICVLNGILEPLLGVDNHLPINPQEYVVE